MPQHWPHVPWISLSVWEDVSATTTFYRQESRRHPSERVLGRPLLPLLLWREALATVFIVMTSKDHELSCTFYHYVACFFGQKSWVSGSELCTPQCELPCCILVYGLKCLEKSPAFSARAQFLKHGTKRTARNNSLSKAAFFKVFDFSGVSSVRELRLKQCIMLAPK